jgi:hypothetical protein
MAIETMKSNKATELDNIHGKVYKVGGELLETQIYNLIVQIREAEAILKEWQNNTLSPIYKKGDTFNCKNYRGMSLLCIAYIILTNILTSRLRPYAD